MALALTKYLATRVCREVYGLEYVDNGLQLPKVEDVTSPVTDVTVGHVWYPEAGTIVQFACIDAGRSGSRVTLTGSGVTARVSRMIQPLSVKQTTQPFRDGWSSVALTPYAADADDDAVVEAIVVERDLTNAKIWDSAEVMVFNNSALETAAWTKKVAPKVGPKIGNSKRPILGKWSAPQTSDRVELDAASTSLRWSWGPPRSRRVIDVTLLIVRANGADWNLSPFDDPLLVVRHRTLHGAARGTVYRARLDFAGERKGRAEDIKAFTKHLSAVLPKMLYTARTFLGPKELEKACPATPQPVPLDLDPTLDVLTPLADAVRSYWARDLAGPFFRALCPRSAVGEAVETQLMNLIFDQPITVDGRVNAYEDSRRQRVARLKRLQQLHRPPP